MRRDPKGTAKGKKTQCPECAMWRNLMAACRRALTAWDMAAEDGQYDSLYFARKQAALARRAMLRAEGKEKP